MTYQPIGNNYQGQAVYQQGPVDQGFQPTYTTVTTSPMHQSPYGQPQSEVTTHHVISTGPSFWNKKVGQQANCQFCHSNMVTYTRMEDGIFTYLACGGICLTGFICGCCLIPFFVEDLKNTNHYCSSCHAMVGTRAAF